MSDVRFLEIVTGSKKVFVGIPDSRDSIAFVEFGGITVAIGLKAN